MSVFIAGVVVALEHVLSSITELAQELVSRPAFLLEEVFRLVVWIANEIHCFEVSDAVKRTEQRAGGVHPLVVYLFKHAICDLANLAIL